MDRTEILLALQQGPRNRSNQLAVDLFIDRIAYDASSNVEYIGIAPQGTATSEAKWRIAKLSYDGSNRYTGSLISAPDQIWDNRTSVTYS